MASKFKGKSKAGKAAKSKVSAFARAAASSETREQGEEFDPGSFRVKFKEAREAENGSIGITFTGAGDDEDLGERVQWFSTKGKASYVSGPRIKSLCMALLGMGKADEDTYNEFDPAGEFLDAIIRSDLDAAAEYMAEHDVAKNADVAREALDEAEVIIKVTKGGEKDDGGFFKNASFKPVEDDSEEDSDDEDDEEPESERKPAKKKAAAKRKPSRDEDDSEEDEDEDEEDEEDEEAPESEPAPRGKKKARRK